jgi:hypothetical protein
VRVTPDCNPANPKRLGQGDSIALARAVSNYAALATAREQGLADVDVSNWSAFFLPKGTPPAIVQKLRDATVVTMNTSAIRARLDENGNRFGCSRAQVCRIPARFRQERDQKMGRADQGVRRECRLTDASARQYWPVRPPSDVTALGRGSICGLGQTEKYSARADVFRFSPKNGRWFSAPKTLRGSEAMERGRHECERSEMAFRRILESASTE